MKSMFTADTFSTSDILVYLVNKKRVKNRKYRPMLLQNIDDGIYLVMAENEGRFPYSFSFLLTGQRNILLDAGAGRKIIEELKKEVEIDLVIISHTHGDHISSCWVLRDIPCFVPEMKWKSVLSIEELGRRFITNDETALSQWKNLMVSTIGCRPFEPAGTYGDGHIFSTGKHELHAIHTPGHTIDHFCLFESKSRTLFSFDVDLTSFGPWYGHNESDISSFQSSIKRIKKMQVKTVASSHVQPLKEDISHHLEQYETHFSLRERRILSLYEEGLSLQEMVMRSPIYNGHPHIPELLMYFERVMIEKHLHRLGLKPSR